jgi:predicted DNA-binding transcriptional regulator YafY
MMMLTSNNTYTIEDLSSRLGASPRTIYRYIDTFKEAGFVVSKKGDYFRLDKKSRYFKDISQLVHFTEEEAYILNSAIESIDPTNVIKQNLKSKLASVYDFKMLAECVVKGENARNVNSLIEAIEEKRQVILHNYTSAHSKNVSDRLVEPIKFSTNYADIYAYEVASGKTKTFKISRIRNVSTLLKNWQHEDKHDNIEADCFRMTGKEDIPVTLRMTLKAKNLLVEEYPLASRHLSFDGEFWWFKANVKDLSGVGRFAIGLADQIQIVNSSELINYVIKFKEKNLNHLNCTIA